MLSNAIPALETADFGQIVTDMRTGRPIIPADGGKSSSVDVGNWAARSSKDTDLVSIDTLRATDYGNAQRLAVSHGADFRYCTPWGKWLVYTGKRWEVDATNEIERRAKATVRGLYREAADSEDLHTRNRIVGHATKSESRERINAMISLAKSEPGIPVTPDQLNTNRWVLNVDNGTVDLKTGTLRPHQRGDLIMKLAPIEYEPAAACPRWEAFLARIMGNDLELISCLQQAIGYALTGDTSEQCLFFLYGAGANGKSTFLETVRAMMGDYAQQAEFITLLKSENGGDRIRNDIAALDGARLVTASEVESGRSLDETTVKQLTGGDTIRARRLYQESYEFRPQAKIFLAANHKPNIRGTDYGIWRRIKLIPFNITIPETDQDPRLPEKLARELPGILRWAVDGCLAWQSLGRLVVPQVVRDATAEFRTEMDVLGTFLGDRCVVTPTEAVKCADLYANYRDWCKENGRCPMNSTNFGKALSERGFGQLKGTAGARMRSGLTLRRFG